MRKCSHIRAVYSLDALLNSIMIYGLQLLRPRLRVVPHFSSGIDRIFTRARVSLALLSLRKNGGLLVVY